MSPCSRYFVLVVVITVFIADLEIVELLLEHKSRINELSSFGTPLHEVCASEHPTAKTKQMCEFLIKHGAGIQTVLCPTPQGSLYFVFDLFSDVKLQCDVVLMPAGVDSTPQRKVGWTPLHVACIPKSVLLLIQSQL